MLRRGGRPASLARLFSVAAAGSMVAAALGCNQQFGPDAELCGRVVRFHLGLHNPVEVLDAESTPDKPHVRIAFRGTGEERSTVDGTALCRLSDQTGQLQVVGAFVDGVRLENGAIRAFNRFMTARKRAADP